MNKSMYLPEAQNDFLFAFVGNPWSLLLIPAAILGLFLWKRWKSKQ